MTTSFTCLSVFNTVYDHLIKLLGFQYKREDSALWSDFIKIDNITTLDEVKGQGCE